LIKLRFKTSIFNKILSFKKIILVEFSVSHTEILHTVISFLNSSGYEVHIWVNRDSGLDATLVPDTVKINLRKNNSIISNLTFTLRLFVYILRHGISKVYINTAHGLLVRNFCLLSYLFSFEIIGLMHHGEKMKGSKTQAVISGKIKKYFVLSDYIRSNMEKLYGNKYKFSVFYPIILKKPSDFKKQLRNEILICIPGEISDKRKNFKILLDTVRDNKERINGNIIFDVLGKVKYEWNQRYLKEMNSPELNNIFITYKEYISNDRFYERISECDLILPLIIPGVENFDNYLKYQISGAYNMAYIFKKPLLLYDNFKEMEEFRDISVFYNEENFSEVLQGLADRKDLFDKLSQNIKTSKRLDFDYQRKKFMEFLSLKIR